MGFSLFFECNGKPAQYIMKLSCYPTQLWYTKDEIPDQSLPVELDASYLIAYQHWLENIIFHLEHITDEMFKQLYPDRRSGPAGIPGLVTRQAMIEDTKYDLKRVIDFYQAYQTCLENEYPCKISVG